MVVFEENFLDHVLSKMQKIEKLIQQYEEIVVFVLFFKIRYSNCLILFTFFSKRRLIFCYYMMQQKEQHSHRKIRFFLLFRYHNLSFVYDAIVKRLTHDMELIKYIKSQNITRFVFISYSISV